MDQDFASILRKQALRKSQIMKTIGRINSWKAIFSNNALFTLLEEPRLKF